MSDIVMKRPPEHYLRQARAKYRIIGKREMRDFLSSKSGFLRERLDERTTLDAIQKAYEAGYRAAQTEGGAP